mgnify:CR=1 FL=1
MASECEMKVCEACGRLEADQWLSTGLWPGMHDLCLPCSLKSNEQLREAITARRSAQAQPEVLDADEVPIRVGDRVVVEKVGSALMAAECRQ